MASVNSTRAFLGDEAGASVRLDGMNGLWGGRRMYVSRAGRAVHRWAGDRQARFDGVCALLSQIEPLTADLSPTYSGPSAWEYVPEGF